MSPRSGVPTRPDSIGSRRSDPGRRHVSGPPLRTRPVPSCAGADERLPVGLSADFLDPDSSTTLADLAGYDDPDPYGRLLRDIYKRDVCQGSAAPLVAGSPRGEVKIVHTMSRS